MREGICESPDTESDWLCPSLWLNDDGTAIPNPEAAILEAEKLAERADEIIDLWAYCDKECPEDMPCFYSPFCDAFAIRTDPLHGAGCRAIPRLPLCRRCNDGSGKPHMHKYPKCPVKLHPPPSPPPPSPSVPVVIEPDLACTATFEDCYHSHCCASEKDACFGRAGRRFAMCKPLRLQKIKCEEDPDWLCPGWWNPPPSPPMAPSPSPPLECAEDYADCYNSICCKAHKHQGCFKSATHKFAMCRPLPSGDCVDGDWLCPGWWHLSSPPPPPSPLPSPPSPPTPPPPVQCGDTWRSCWDSRCCMNKYEGCFKRNGHRFAMCRPMKEVRSTSH